MTGSGNKTFWTDDTIAGAILGCVGGLFLQSKLDVLIAKLNNPVLATSLKLWPLLFIVAGLVLLLGRSSGGNSSRQTTIGQLGGGK